MCWELGRSVRYFGSKKGHLDEGFRQVFLVVQALQLVFKEAYEGCPKVGFSELTGPGLLDPWDDTYCRRHGRGQMRPCVSRFDGSSKGVPTAKTY